jgi:hypothetical protein
MCRPRCSRALSLGLFCCPTSFPCWCVHLFLSPSCYFTGCFSLVTPDCPPWIWLSHPSRICLSHSSLGALFCRCVLLRVYFTGDSLVASKRPLALWAVFSCPSAAHCRWLPGRLRSWFLKSVVTLPPSLGVVASQLFLSNCSAPFILSVR